MTGNYYQGYQNWNSVRSDHYQARTSQKKEKGLRRLANTIIGLKCNMGAFSGPCR